MLYPGPALSMHARAFDSVDDVFDLLHSRVAARAGCDDEGTAWSHALRTAALAQQGGACDALIVAALLHDVGHFLGAAPPSREAVTVGMSENAHAELGAAALASLFPPSVTAPIRLHVQAARYLWTTQPGTEDCFGCGGPHGPGVPPGPMKTDERLRFMTHRHAGHALRLAHWDAVDAGPIDGRRLDLRFRQIAQSCLRAVDFA